LPRLNGSAEKIANKVADSGHPIYGRSVRCFAYREIIHKPFELWVLAVKTLEFLREKLLIVQALTLEDFFCPKAFDLTEIVIL
jgi:hypothetical protein